MKKKLLLKRDVPSLGITGDVVEVSPGYARNRLLPMGLALEINESAQQAIAKAKRERDKHEAARKSQMEDIASAITNTRVSIPVPVSEAGTMYSAVSPSQIAAALEAQGVTIAPDAIRPETPLKSVGEHTVPIHLHSDVDSELRVEIVPDETAERPVVEEDEDEGLAGDRDEDYGVIDEDEDDRRR
jgi:large subunit ribosomal protein L9